jgi:hypothetical protein
MEETQTTQTETQNKPKKKYNDNVLTPEAYHKKKADERNKLKSKQKRR